MPSSILVETTNYLNSIIKGRTLRESKEIISKEIKSDTLNIDNLAEKLINQGFACWDDASKKNKLLITGTSKLLEDVNAMEQLEMLEFSLKNLKIKKT